MGTRVLRFCDHHKTGEDVPASVVPLQYDGKTYEADLCDEHQQEWKTLDARMQELLREASVVAKKAAARPNRTRTPRPSGDAARELRAIRTWAAETGHALNPRGRIPVDVRTAWEAAGRPGSDDDGAE